MAEGTHEPIIERDPTERSKHRKEPVNPVLKLALEMGPLAVFFFANFRGAALIERFPALGAFGGPLFFATACFMVAAPLALIVSWALTRTLPLMPLVSGLVVLVFGGLTLWLQDERFIKMKPTMVNALFGATLLGGLVFGKSLLGYVFDAAFQLDADGWKKLTFRWALFFFFLAVLNEVVWRNFSTDFWVSFKTWGMFPLTVLFTLSQMPLILRHSIEDRAETSEG